MSFILDALRKSESERHRLGAASIAELPVGQQRTQPWWVIALAALLAANLVLLLAVMLRPKDDSQTAPAMTSSASVSSASVATPAPTSPPSPSSTANASLADAAAPPVQYEYVDREAIEAASAAPDGPTLVRPLDAAAKDQAANTAGLAEQPANLADLHLDMHVYAPRAAQRFVFINKRKYTEGQTLTEGPRVEQIAADGVVLTYRGTRWQIARP